MKIKVTLVLLIAMLLLTGCYYPLEKWKPTIEDWKPSWELVGKGILVEFEKPEGVTKIVLDTKTYLVPFPKTVSLSEGHVEVGEYYYLYKDRVKYVNIVASALRE